jgi:hypothetical protein
VSKQYALLFDEEAVQERRSDYDVTNSVQVSSTPSVRRAVRELFESLYPGHSFDPVWLAFHDFERLFLGLDPEYHGVDTAYHDMQHTLDMTLATARLIVGYEGSVPAADRLGAERAKFALVSALFHDSGYLRHRIRDWQSTNGAEFTLSHVGRSGRFIEEYLPKVGLDAFVSVAARVVHFTGYEISLDSIELDNPKDSTVGHLLGTADLLAQLADRCYLEKCRDRLYPEFVLGNVAVRTGPDGAEASYDSGRDLLVKTMDFYHKSAQYRMDHSFNRAYRYVETLFENHINPYIAFIHKNLAFLKRVQETDDWDKLRRRPPCVMPDPNGEARLMTLALAKLREISETERASGRRVRALNPVFNFGA